MQPRYNYLPINIDTLFLFIRQVKAAKEKNISTRIITLNFTSSLICRFLNIPYLALYNKETKTELSEGAYIQLSDILSPQTYIYSKKRNYPLFSLMERRLARNLKEGLETNKFRESFIIWNGQTAPAQIVSQIAKSKNLPIVFLENGYFPNTTQIDPKGVNRLSSINSLIKNYPHSLHCYNNSEQNIPTSTPTASNTENSKSFLKKTVPPILKFILSVEVTFVRSISVINEAESISAYIKRMIKKLIWRTSFYSPKDWKSKNLKIFFPLQVHDDTQLMGSSFWIKLAPENYFSATINYLENLKLAAHVKVRNHPKDKYRYNYRHYSTGKELTIEFDDTTPLTDLIEDAHAVITFNSTVGFEALLKNKAVFLIGSNFYEGLPNCYDIRDIETLKDGKNLTPYKYTEEDAALLRSIFCSANWRNNSSKDQLEIFEKIHSLIEKHSQLA